MNGLDKTRVRTALVLLKACLKFDRFSRYFSFALPLLCASLISLHAVEAEPAQRLLSCSVPAAVAWSYGPVSNLARAVSRHRPVTIIALGSSSTVGIGASSETSSYVSRMKATISLRFADVPISVINAGKGGETASQMLRRLNRDVVSRKPDLVIWQTGVNDAIAGVDLNAFKATLQSGIVRLRRRGIDVVIIDQQDFPRAADVRNYSAYLGVLSRVSTDLNVAQLQRNRIMQYLASQGRVGFNGLLAADGFHMNDVGHDCVGRILADGLAVMAVGGEQSLH